MMRDFLRGLRAVINAEFLGFMAGLFIVILAIGAFGGGLALLVSEIARDQQEHRPSLRAPLQTAERT